MAVNRMVDQSIAVMEVWRSPSFWDWVRGLCHKWVLNGTQQWHHMARSSRLVV